MEMDEEMEGLDMLHKIQGSKMNMDMEEEMEWVRISYKINKLTGEEIE